MLSAESSTRAVTPSGRISYARIDKKVDGVSYEKFEIPNLIELQLEFVQLVHREGPARAVRRDQPDQGLHRQGSEPASYSSPLKAWMDPGSDDVAL